MPTSTSCRASLFCSVGFIASLGACSWASAQGDEVVVAAGEVLELDGGVREFVRVQAGGTLRTLDGPSGGPFIDGVTVEAGGNADIQGGLFGIGLENRGGEVAFSGGQITSLDIGAGVVDYTAGEASVVVVGDIAGVSASGAASLNVLSGWDEQDFGILVVGADGAVNVLGGRLFDAFDTIGFEDFSELNLFGSQFAVNGVPVSGPPIGQSLRIDDREVVLSGLLSDGSPFAFNLSVTGGLDPGTVEATALAVVTLTRTVPEPTGGLLLVIASGGLSAAYRRRG